MSCCGKKRDAWRGESPQTPRAHPKNSQFIYFRYTGNKILKVVGPVSGHVYEFSGSGAAAATDPRDAPSIAAVPHLVQVNSL